MCTNMPSGVALNYILSKELLPSSVDGRCFNSADNKLLKFFHSLSNLSTQIHTFVLYNTRCSWLPLIQLALSLLQLIVLHVDYTQDDPSAVIQSFNYPTLPNIDLHRLHIFIFV
ncbi:unnamed protein product [Rotaria sp. Silwood2]|nr:unnamed protein product [Rotaria sp. Silwood2]